MLMSQQVKRVGKVAIRLVGYGLIGGFVTLVSVFGLYLQGRPELAIWHEVELDAEFTADSNVGTFAEYLATEERVFQQLDERVYAQIPADSHRLVNRYNRGSLADPVRWPRNWNRTFELPNAKPTAGVLLLHGMSDSPYSLRAIGQRLHEAGASVVGLRLPGHGTAPSGLTDVRWEDMAAAVGLAARHVHDLVADRPIYLVGYSNGGALAVRYALEQLGDDDLPRVNGIVLISPAIGVTPLAALAVWQSRVGHLLDLDRLEWNDIRPEYDPFKYNSFAVNAGYQVHLLTKEIARLIAQHKNVGDLDRLPPILAFQSVVDATVSSAALINNLMGKLPSSGHELVLFDINRLTQIEPILWQDPRNYFQPLLENGALSFRLTLVTNIDGSDPRVMLRARESSAGDIRDIAADLAWPQGVYALSHVALPFPQNDPIYGASRPLESPGIHLGNLALRGERGVLKITDSDMLRQRWNPFYSLMEDRILDFLRLPGMPAPQR